MSKLRCHISISLDGFVAGPNQSEENPLGEGGERLHDWVVPLAAWREPHDKQGGEVNESTRIIEESRENVGAAVMGRNMFGPVGGGAWGDEQWTGWWGDNPPYHYPVFIVTHHPRDPVEMEGGTTFHFVTDGIESALEQAKEAAGGKDVMLWGGGSIAQQYLAAGLLDELELHVVPVLLGDGARLFDNLGNGKVQLEQVRAVEAPGVTHLKYRVVTMNRPPRPACEKHRRESQMPELMIDFITSLDGYGAAEGWPGWWGLEGPEYLAWLGDQPEAGYTVLMGANTYRLMSGLVADGEPGTDALTGLSKIVFSSTLTEPLSWGNTRLVTQDAVEAVREMKDNGSESMRTMGSLTLCRSLLNAGLVDRFRVVVFPVITGSTGRDRIYDGYADLSLDMVSSRTFDGRLQLLEYVPTVLAGPPGTGKDDA